MEDGDDVRAYVVRSLGVLDPVLDDSEVVLEVRLRDDASADPTGEDVVNAVKI